MNIKRAKVDGVVTYTTKVQLTLAKPLVTTEYEHKKSSKKTFVKGANHAGQKR